MRPNSLIAYKFLLFLCYSLAVKGSSQDSSKLKDSNNQDILNCDGEPT